MKSLACLVTVNCQMASTAFIDRTRLIASSAVHPFVSSMPVFLILILDLVSQVIQGWSLGRMVEALPILKS
jgi:hypothetical protein